ncbi:MAG: hypothetical protein GY914_04150 [Prochlorococcus sp.]|nr:hypothetical protein [Prochlorococcus sp.]
MDRSLSADTIGKIPCRSPTLMAVSEQPSTFEHLLSQQLHSFSELTETLTLRLLELEERVTSFETMSTDAQESHIEEATQILLDKSKDRVGNLLGLLDIDQQKAPILQAVPDASLQDEMQPEVELEEAEPEDEVVAQDIDGEFDDSELGDTQYVDDPQMPLLSA